MTSIDKNRHADLEWILQNPYFGYSYAYPHKLAYRTFHKPKALKDLWSQENKDNLFLYMHIPFCEMRCGFCNLFTTANPKQSLVQIYREALKRQIDSVSEALGNMKMARFALGGGTPTYLEAHELSDLLDLLQSKFNLDVSKVPSSIETSPQTATPERLAMLSAKGFERISIGVQSFIEDETKAMGRPQKKGHLENALNTIRDYAFKRLNIDLIYGAENQTIESWTTSIQTALHWDPEEIYLYPLYVRPLTGLDGKAKTWDQHRQDLYRAGRDFLLNAGYQQISMRAFTKQSILSSSSEITLEYCCQEDGMIGLGAGARSYTEKLHYSSEYAVKKMSVMSLLQDYCTTSTESFKYAHHGVELNQDEMMRRYIIKSVLRKGGLNISDFLKKFSCQPIDIYSELALLIENKFLHESHETVTPTQLGLEYADAIGPWLYSKTMKNMMQKGQIE